MMRKLPTIVTGAVQVEGPSNRGVEPVRINLLGSFLVSIGSRTYGEERWRLGKAAALIKLLALAPIHRLPRTSGTMSKFKRRSEHAKNP